MRSAKRIRELITKNTDRLSLPPIAPEHAAFLMDDNDQLKYELSYAEEIERLYTHIEKLEAFIRELPVSLNDLERG